MRSGLQTHTHTHTRDDADDGVDGYSALCIPFFIWYRTCQRITANSARNKFFNSLSINKSVSWSNSPLPPLRTARAETQQLKACQRIVIYLFSVAFVWCDCVHGGWVVLCANPCVRALHSGIGKGCTCVRTTYTRISPFVISVDGAPVPHAPRQKTKQSEQRVGSRYRWTTVHAFALENGWQRRCGKRKRLLYEKSFVLPLMMISDGWILSFVDVCQVHSIVGSITEN